MFTHSFEHLENVLCEHPERAAQTGGGCRLVRYRTGKGCPTKNICRAFATTIFQVLAKNGCTKER